MLTKAEILDYINGRKEFYYSEYGIIKIGVFGSFATDKNDNQSDIDFLVEFEPGTTNLYSIKSNLRKELKSRFNRNIDLCREKYLKPYFKTQILESSIYA